MSVVDVENRLRVLQDIEEIRRLKARYCSYADRYDSEAIVSLFTEDGGLEDDAGNVHQGREQLRDFFSNARERLPFIVHTVMNSLIEVDGDEGTGSWYLFQPATMGDSGQAVWGSGRYDEEYIRVGGQWRFKRMKTSLFFWTPFDQGWAKKRFA